MIRCAALFFFFAGVCAGGAQSKAQPNHPNEFYPSGFVASGQGLGDVSTVDQRKDAGPVGRSSAEEYTLPLKESVSSSIVGSVVVNSQDREHFDAVYKKAFTLHSLGRMKIVGIEYIGSYESVSELQRSELAQAGIMLLPRRSLPAEYPITQSPTWRVSKGLETYVIEGFFAPERFFTKEGRFVAPVGMDVERVQDARSDGKLKAF